MVGATRFHRGPRRRARPPGPAPRPPDQHPRPARPHRPPPGPAPARTLALATRLAAPARRRPPSTATTCRLTAHRARQRPTGEPQWKSRTDRQPPHTTTSRHPKEDQQRAVGDDQKTGSVDPGSATWRRTLAVLMKERCWSAMEMVTRWAYLDSTRPIGLAPAVSASRAACQAESPG